MIRAIDRDDINDPPRQIAVDPERRQVQFVNCLWPKKFFRSGFLGEAVCSFEHLRSVQEFGSGPMKRLRVDTTIGHCLIEPGWDGYPAVKDALLEACPHGSRNPLHDARVQIAIQLLLMFAAVGGIIWYALN